MISVACPKCGVRHPYLNSILCTRCMVGKPSSKELIERIKQKKIRFSIPKAERNPRKYITSMGTCKELT